MGNLGKNWLGEQLEKNSREVKRWPSWMRVAAGLIRHAEGVIIWLAPRVRVPLWIKIQDLNISIKRKRAGIGRIRLLRIEDGDAGFVPDGCVTVKMPGSTKHIVSFNERGVLQITDLRGRLLRKNHCLCNKCFRNTGEMVMTLNQSAELENNSEVDMKCSVCGFSWKVKT